MPRIPQLVDHRILRPAETALALNLLSKMDLLRIKAIARLYARGLPADVSWEDLIQEALTRVLVGSRVQPEGVQIVAFVAGIMRSLRSEHRRRAFGGGRRAIAEAESADDKEISIRDPGPDPERALSAVQELAAIQRLFADDPTALQIVAGLGEGLSAEQICRKYRFSRVAYDSARKRMRRTLLREGLSWATES